MRGHPYRLHLLDTAGQERFRTLSNSYYRNAHGVLLVYDVSSRDNFLSMDRWFEEAQTNAMPGVVTYLVGTKIDKVVGDEGRRAVTAEEGQRLADKYGCGFCEVSSKTRENVRRPFVELVDSIVSHPTLLKQGTGIGTRVDLGNGEGTGGWGACAC